jgi:hypothetical protein
MNRKLVEALCYKQESRGLPYRYGNWICYIGLILQKHYGPGVDSVSNRNEYQKSYWGYAAASK